MAALDDQDRRRQRVIDRLLKVTPHDHYQIELADTLANIAAIRGDAAKPHPEPETQLRRRRKPKGQFR